MPKVKVWLTIFLIFSYKAKHCWENRNNREVPACYTKSSTTPLLLLGSNLVCVLPTFTFPSLSSRDLKTCFKPFRHTHWPSKSTTAQWAKNWPKIVSFFGIFKIWKNTKNIFLCQLTIQKFHQKCLKFRKISRFVIFFLEFETWRQKFVSLNFHAKIWNVFFF